MHSFAEKTMINFPLQSMMNYDACYEELLRILHPQGLHCRCGVGLRDYQAVHKKNKTGLPSYLCHSCGSVFNLYTGTIFEGIHYNCIVIILLLRGILKGETTQSLSQELGLNYKNLLDWRHKLQEFAYENRVMSVLDDQIVESDEVFINSGEKGEKHGDPQDPPRVRANKKKA